MSIRIYTIHSGAGARFVFCSLLFCLLGCGAGSDAGPRGRVVKNLSSGTPFQTQVVDCLIADNVGLELCEEEDFDGDGLSNGQEEDFSTDPLDPDTDSDSLLDGEEVARGLSPRNADSNCNGLSDAEDAAPLAWERTFEVSTAEPSKWKGTPYSSGSLFPSPGILLEPYRSEFGQMLTWYEVEGCSDGSIWPIVNESAPGSCNPNGASDFYFQYVQAWPEGARNVRLESVNVLSAPAFEMDRLDINGVRLAERTYAPDRTVLCDGTDMFDILSLARVFTAQDCPALEQGGDYPHLSLGVRSDDQPTDPQNETQQSLELHVEVLVTYERAAYTAEECSG